MCDKSSILKVFLCSIFFSFFFAAFSPPHNLIYLKMVYCNVWLFYVCEPHIRLSSSYIYSYTCYNNNTNYKWCLLISLQNVLCTYKKKKILFNNIWEEKQKINFFSFFLLLVGWQSCVINNKVMWINHFSFDVTCSDIICIPNNQLE